MKKVIKNLTLRWIGFEKSPGQVPGPPGMPGGIPQKYKILQNWLTGL